MHPQECGNMQPSPAGSSARVPCAGYLLVPALQHQQLSHRQRWVHAVQDVPQGFPAPRSLCFRNTLWKNNPQVVRTARPGASAPPAPSQAPAPSLTRRLMCRVWELPRLGEREPMGSAMEGGERLW